MPDPTFTEGQRVRFLVDSLGAMRKDGSLGNKFVAETFGRADFGTVVIPNLPDGWIAVEPDGHPHLYVPVHPGMIETAPDA